MQQWTTRILALMVLGWSLSAHAAEPLETLKGPMDRVVQILMDPQYKNEGKAIQRNRIWRLIEDLFDFDEMSKRAVARKWRQFTPEEKKEFTEVFGKLLSNTYLNRAQIRYSNEKVNYVGQEKLTDTKAVVKTIIVGEAGEIPADYSMKLKNGKWRIYDVTIEGLSLISNYRNQFRKILSREKPAQLIAKLKVKVEDQKKP